MDKLIQFLNGMPRPDQIAFAIRCGTSVGYLRKAVSKGHKLGDGLCINIERESCGHVRCEDLRDDIDWAYLRGTACPEDAKAEGCSPAVGPSPGALVEAAAGV